MSAKKSGILSAVSETAADLHAAGLIDKRRMREYAALCSEPIPAYTSEKISDLRKRYHLSQAVLAAILNVHLSTVRQWEHDEKHPSGPSLKLLSILDRKGPEALA